ncbi:MAG: hypoxanthine phosphoribosyltransferase [Myxococcales bacterium]|nr:hypoxanthine phosphoribosyltransferase [Myxococcales bacterium]MCB9582214.1 hypoxanthine phosphoribosyltransferase [Polyangiaceae bacterium]
MADGWYREKIKTLYTGQQIADRIKELGAEITRDYRDKPLVLLCILKGSYMFAADLCRAIDLPLRIEFLGVQSYGDGTSSTGVVQITLDLTRPIEGEEVLVVEDIVDTGLTLDYIQQSLKTRNPASVKVCALLHKPARMQKKIEIDYLGFTIDDVFVVGYGLDWAQKYRNMPEIGVVIDPDG